MIAEAWDISVPGRSGYIRIADRAMTVLQVGTAGRFVSFKVLRSGTAATERQLANSDDVYAFQSAMTGAKAVLLYEADAWIELVLKEFFERECVVASPSADWLAKARGLGPDVSIAVWDWIEKECGILIGHDGDSVIWFRV